MSSETFKLFRPDNFKIVDFPVPGVPVTRITGPFDFDEILVAFDDFSDFLLSFDLDFFTFMLRSRGCLCNHQEHGNNSVKRYFLAVRITHQIFLFV